MDGGELNETKLNVGCVGFSGAKFDVIRADELLIVALDLVVADHPHISEFIGGAGLTNVGIPALFYRAVTLRGWRTAGFACELAYGFERFPVTEKPVIVGKDWGDESAAFLDWCDVIIRIGGGEQSLDEVTRFKADGRRRVYEYDLPALAS